jgi:hypothetical protein
MVSVFFVMINNMAFDDKSTNHAWQNIHHFIHWFSISTNLYTLAQRKDLIAIRVFFCFCEVGGLALQEGIAKIMKDPLMFWWEVRWQQCVNMVNWKVFALKYGEIDAFFLNKSFGTIATPLFGDQLMKFHPKKIINYHMTIKLHIVIWIIMILSWNGVFLKND